MQGGLFMSSPVTFPSRRRLKFWPQKRRWKITVSVLLILFLLVAAASGTIYIYLKRNLPVTEGTLKIDGLREPVTVIRTKHGVPHIYAENRHDLFFAQGFITAQARLFQMDLSRRQASGTLSEVVGKAALERDKFFRTLGLRRWAEKSLPAYSAEARGS